MTRFNLTAGEYERMMGERPRKELKDILLQLQSLEKKAADIIDKLPAFTFPAFEKAFIQNRGLSDTVNYTFDEYINQLKSENRIGSAVSYDVAKVSLNKFCVEQKILIEKRVDEFGKERSVSNYTFSYITPAFLKRYEKWMLESGNSITTVGIYLRSLRALFNQAIENGQITKEFYPFGKRKYEIPASKNTKKSLTLADIGLIYNYEPIPYSTAARMRDYWLFMYFCNGINVKDLCRLKFKNIQGDFIVFQRAKTERTKRVSEEIRVPYSAELKAIVDRWGNKAINPEVYIFPELVAGLSAEQEYNMIQLLTRLINDHMKQIAAYLDIKVNLTTYVARHSFATVLKRSGASVEFISEALGHSNLKTTQSYLASFEDDKKKEVAKALTAFKNVS
ncbi:tyrosine-type recombinase/integrase [Parafilimonas sp.]|uniref:tyrosine-type recombinase/integrase n=1 Tax=Parafilimonas sp. TaxID=1969739 RepID=UPI0039E572BD